MESKASWEELKRLHAKYQRLAIKAPEPTSQQAEAMRQISSTFLEGDRTGFGLVGRQLFTQGYTERPAAALEPGVEPQKRRIRGLLDAADAVAMISASRATAFNLGLTTDEIIETRVLPMIDQAFMTPDASRREKLVSMPRSLFRILMTRARLERGKPAAEQLYAGALYKLALVYLRGEQQVAGRYNPPDFNVFERVNLILGSIDPPNPDMLLEVVAILPWDMSVAAFSRIVRVGETAGAPADPTLFARAIQSRAMKNALVNPRFAPLRVGLQYAPFFGQPNFFDAYPRA